MKLSPRRLLLVGVVCMVSAASIAAVTPVVFGRPQPMVRVTWRAIDPALKRELEQRFGLSEPAHAGDATWSYVPLDTSSRTLRSIVFHPLVADTDGINRRAFTIAATSPLTPRRGGLWTAAPRGSAGLVVFAAWTLGVAATGTLIVALFLHGGARRNIERVSRALGRRPPASAALASAAAMLLIFATVVGYRFLAFEQVTNDHFTYLTFAHQSALGDLPVRDYDDPGFPLMIALSAMAMRIGGLTLLPEVLLTAATFGVAACLTWRASTAATRMPVLALAATALQVLAYPRPYSYPKILMPACAMLLFLAYGRRPTRTRLVGLALLTELAFLLRHDLAVYLLVATVALILFVHRLTRVAFERLGWYALAGICFTIPYAAYLLAFGVEAHFAAAFGFSRSEAVRTAGWTSVVMSGAPLVLAVLALPLVVAAWLAIDRWRRGTWRSDAPAVAATAVLMAMIDVGMLRDTTPTRLADVFGPAPMLAAWLGAQVVAGFAALRNRLVRVAGIALAAAVGIGLLVATAQFGGLRHNLAEARFDDGWRGVRGHAVRQTSLLHEWPWTGKYQGLAHEPLARYINRCTSSAEPVLIVGYLPHLPMIARRPFAGGHSWLLPGYFTSASDQARMAQWLAERPPAVVVIQPGDATHLEKDWPAIAKRLAGYREPRMFNGLQIRTARRSAIRSVHAETGLDCLW